MLKPKLFGTVLILAGWWQNNPSENYEFVSWDDDIPNMNEKP